MMAGGFTREHLDTPSPSPWSVIEEEFNYVTLIAWEEPADGCEDLAAEVLLLPIDAARRTWSYLKNKWASIKSEYTLPLSRWTASGQGDPEAVFADFQSAQDSHPKVALYLHHRLASLRDDLDADSLASMDGMVSRLIRVDAISDNGSKKRGSVEEGAATASKRVTSSGGFLDNASEADLTRLFSAAPASPPVQNRQRPQPPGALSQYIPSRPSQSAWVEHPGLMIPTRMALSAASWKNTSKSAPTKKNSFTDASPFAISSPFISMSDTPSFRMNALAILSFGSQW